MSKPNRKKAMLYGLLLGGAVIGLLIDRMNSADGSATPAGTTVGLAAGSVVNVATSVEDAKGPAIARVFAIADGMRETEKRSVEGESIRDAFNLSPRMRQFYADTSPAHKAEEVRKAENNEEVRRLEIERFQTAHKLKGTSIREGEAWALIDSNVVRVGERIDGFELRIIERYRVKLAKGDLVVTLSLPMP